MEYDFSELTATYEGKGICLVFGSAWIERDTSGNLWVRSLTLVDPDDKHPPTVIEWNETEKLLSLLFDAVTCELLAWDDVHEKFEEEAA